MANNKDKIFVIGDIHGCADELRLLLRSLPIEDDSLIVFLGDYVDRGPQSREVLEIVLKLKEKYNVVPLMGNHEQMFLKFLEDPSGSDGGMFIFNGGSATLASYADDFGEYEVPETHAKLLTAMPLYHETSDYIFVHAGLPNIPTNKIDVDVHQEDLLWIREEFFDSKFDWGKMVIHGHTPEKYVQFLENRICVDTGCVFNGKLSAVALPSKQVYQVQRQAEWKHSYLVDKTSARKAVRFIGSIPVIIDGYEKKLFETRNYTEFGMLIKDVSGNKISIFKDHQPITGEIGDNKTEDAIRFKGEILRSIQEIDGIYYAIQFTLENVVSAQKAS